MKTIKILLDFLAGPIWKPYYNSKTNKDSTGVDVVDNDEEIAKLNDEIQDLYSSYYYFDYNGQACYFDEKQERADKDKMLSLLNKLNNRLNEINDGSFIVDDRETERVRAL
ncbi:MAG: hypothetical protein IJL14_01520 [Selenomonadaceae bacterium]|nr:hypothetical protein [Selenomonadaceae bacterium]